MDQYSLQCFPCWGGSDQNMCWQPTTVLSKSCWRQLSNKWRFFFCNIFIVVPLLLSNMNYSFHTGDIFNAKLKLLKAFFGLSFHRKTLWNLTWTTNQSLWSESYYFYLALFLLFSFQTNSWKIIKKIKQKTKELSSKPRFTNIVLYEPWGEIPYVINEDLYEFMAATKQSIVSDKVSHAFDFEYLKG